MFAIALGENEIKKKKTGIPLWHIDITTKRLSLTWMRRFIYARLSILAIDS